MKKNNSKQLTPMALRLLLTFSMFLLAAGCVATFLFLQSQLKSLALETSKANSEANLSKGDLARLKELSEYLEKEKAAVNRVKNIVADTQSYQYQDQIIQDITLYAQKSGISVTGVNFQSSGQPATTTTSGGTTAQQQPAATTSEANFTTAIINIKNPVQYRSVMQFLYYLENNLTRMQVTEVSLTKGDGSGQDVSINPLSVKVYTK